MSKNKKIQAVTLGVLLSGIVLALRHTVFSPSLVLIPAQSLTIQQTNFCLTNFVETIEPVATNRDWYTNYYGTNLVISGWCLRTAHIGNTVQLTWSATNVVLQCSSNLVDWSDLRIWFIGVSNWLVAPYDPRQYYRLRDW